MQRNWIGKSVGANVRFLVPALGEHQAIEVFTSRVDTIYGVNALVLAPEHEWVEQLTNEAHRAEITGYIAQTKKKSETDRMSDARSVSGAFTGNYSVHPLTGKDMPKLDT